MVHPFLLEYEHCYLLLKLRRSFFGTFLKSTPSLLFIHLFIYFYFNPSGLESSLEEQLDVSKGCRGGELEGDITRTGVSQEENTRQPSEKAGGEI